MSGNELTLASLINSYRYFGYTLAPSAAPPNATNVGVAQWHAQNMAKGHYVALVASDGEDPFRRIVCSGGAPNVATSVIAVGYSTDPQGVFDGLQLDPGASAILANRNTKTSVSVGYSDGYWMIIIQ